MSARPLYGSIISPVAGFQEIALMVKSRRSAASFGVMVGSACTSKSWWRAPVRFSRRGTETSMGKSFSLVTPKAAPTLMIPNLLRRAFSISRVPIPKTSISKSFIGRPNRASRTQPPTINGVPPAFRKSSKTSTVSACSPVKAMRLGLTSGTVMI